MAHPMRGTISGPIVGASTPCWAFDPSGLEYYLLIGLLKALRGPLPLGVFLQRMGHPGWDREVWYLP